jgi:hypothetical protein
MLLDSSSSKYIERLAQLRVALHRSLMAPRLAPQSSTSVSQLDIQPTDRLWRNARDQNWLVLPDQMASRSGPSPLEMLTRRDRTPWAGAAPVVSTGSAR